MYIVVRDELFLTELRPADRPTICEHLQAPEIAENTLSIPYPYGETDAEKFLAFVREEEERQGRPVTWAVRDADDYLIGTIGFKGLAGGRGFRADVGYWLAKPYWGRGIMTEVVRTACACAFLDFGLTKITAHVFPHNPSSARVLEKCGFQEEGYLRKHFQKGDRVLDARLFGLVREQP